DGIRDDLVTGVQTCALPICQPAAAFFAQVRGSPARGVTWASSRGIIRYLMRKIPAITVTGTYSQASNQYSSTSAIGSARSLATEIGRASGRERVEIMGVGGV